MQISVPQRYNVKGKYVSLQTRLRLMPQDKAAAEQKRKEWDEAGRGMTERQKHSDIMKRILLLVTVFAGLTFSGCSDDDESTQDTTTDTPADTVATENSLEFADGELYQTTWQGQDTRFEYRSDDGITYQLVGVDGASFKLQFITDSTGYYIDFLNENMSKFGYRAEGRILEFTYGPDAYELKGNWTVTDRSGGRITLEAYLPDKHVMTLEKMY